MKKQCAAQKSLLQLCHSSYQQFLEQTGLKILTDVNPGIYSINLLFFMTLCIFIFAKLEKKSICFGSTLPYVRARSHCLTHK